MPDLTVKDQIKKLIDLQKIDGEIYECKVAMEEKPKEIEILKSEFEAKKAHLNELEGKLKEIQLKRKESELELQGKEGQIAKANADLNALKTNKEYTAKISEIESMKADRSRVEEKILISYDEADQITEDINKEKELVATEEKYFNEKKQEVQGEIKVLEDRVAVLDGQRKQIAPNIEPDLLNRYERVLHRKQGLAIAPVVGSNCGGCYMNVTHQQINEIKMGEELVSCESCNRILYLEDNL